jgi:hypothetical protein
MSLTFVNLVTPKAQAKHELLFNKPASEVGLLHIPILYINIGLWFFEHPSLT